MKLLVLSFYFPPDLSAGSFRCGALVKALRERLPPGSLIDIVTTLPNRYRSFAGEAPEHEVYPGLEVHRINLPQHQSDMLGQSRAFWTFARQALQHVEERDYDLVFATSSRLMTAALAARIARRKRLPLYLDIRDIFVDTLKDVLPRPLAVPLVPLLMLLESRTMRSADKINLVSAGFQSYFKARYPEIDYSFFTNGIDEEFLQLADLAQPERTAQAPLTVLYAGNVGEGQGLHAIIPPLAMRMRGRIRFQVVGDGGRMRALQDALAAAGVGNVDLIAPVKRDRLIDLYSRADVLFLHLNDYDAFRKVLPSKVFEYAAMGKPIWAGVAGYAAAFMRQEVQNSAVFHPCDVEGAIQAFNALAIESCPRATFVQKFDRRRITEAMADDIVALQAARPRSPPVS